MKKYQKVLSVLFSSLLIFCAVSCANDSVEEETNNQKPNENNNYNPQIDGTYPITVQEGKLEATLNQLQSSGEGLEYGAGTIVLNNTSESTVTSCSEKSFNGKYFYYEFELPEKVIKELIGDTKIDPGFIIKGVVLSRTPIINKNMNLIISNNGKNLKTDSIQVSLCGIYRELKDFSLLKINAKTLDLLDIKNTKITFQDNKYYDYVGTWKYTNTDVAYTIIVNDDKTGSYDFGGTEKGNFAVSTSKLNGIEFILESGKKFGVFIMKEKGKATFEAIEKNVVANKKDFIKETLTIK